MPGADYSSGRTYRSNVPLYATLLSFSIWVPPSSRSRHCSSVKVNGAESFCYAPPINDIMRASRLRDSRPVSPRCQYRESRPLLITDSIAAGYLRLPILPGGVDVDRAVGSIGISPLAARLGAPVLRNTDMWSTGQGRCAPCRIRGDTANIRNAARPFWSPFRRRLPLTWSGPSILFRSSFGHCPLMETRSTDAMRSCVCCWHGGRDLFAYDHDVSALRAFQVAFVRHDRHFVAAVYTDKAMSSHNALLSSSAALFASRARGG